MWELVVGVLEINLNGDIILFIIVFFNVIFIVLDDKFFVLKDFNYKFWNDNKNNNY